MSSATTSNSSYETSLGFLLFPYLPENDRKNLARTSNTWFKAKIEFHVKDYEILKDRIQNKNQSVFVKDGNGIHQEIFLNILGRGGSKRAVEISNGRALLVPNMDHKPLRTIISNWERVVNEEVVMSQLLTKVGILSPLSQRVTILLSEEGSYGTIPAYLSETFENLGKTKGWFILDMKNFSSSTWQRGKNYLFYTTEDRLMEKNWDFVVDPLLTDIAKIILYNIPSDEDSINVAIVKNSLESTISQYNVRYFGFDYTHPYISLSIPKITVKPVLNIESATCKAKKLLRPILDFVFFNEFGRSFRDGTEKEKSIILYRQLIEKYSNNVIQRIQDISKLPNLD